MKFECLAHHIYEHGCLECALEYLLQRLERLEKLVEELEHGRRL
jgi:hypothetical protein